MGYSIADRMTADLAVAALRMAIQRRRPEGTTVHSERGSQFRSRRFVLELGRAGLTGSMGWVGAAGDNAAMESFFALLQKNVLDQQQRSTRTELRLAIVHWIEAITDAADKTHPGPFDPDRIRDDHDHAGRVRGLRQRVTTTISSPTWISRSDPCADLAVHYCCRRSTTGAEEASVSDATSGSDEATTGERDPSAPVNRLRQQKRRNAWRDEWDESPLDDQTNLGSLRSTNRGRNA